jgi:hypothetical protein
MATAPEIKAFVMSGLTIEKVSCWTKCFEGELGHFTR